MLCWAVESRAWIPSQRRSWGARRSSIQSLDPVLLGWAVESRAWIPSQLSALSPREEGCSAQGACEREEGCSAQGASILRLTTSGQ